MPDIVPIANKVRVSVSKNCTAIPQIDGAAVEACEHLIYLTVPRMGGDGILLGVTETAEAAETIASALSLLLSTAHTHA